MKTSSGRHAWTVGGTRREGRAIDLFLLYYFFYCFAFSLCCLHQSLVKEDHTPKFAHSERQISKNGTPCDTVLISSQLIC
jgi:hypothetical protein